MKSFDKNVNCLLSFITINVQSEIFYIINDDWQSVSL